MVLLFGFVVGVFLGGGRRGVLLFIYLKLVVY